MTQGGAHVLLAGRYELDELLGRGAMGEVWRAADHVLGRSVAVKLLRAEEATDTERFRREAQIAGRLNHPNVVGVHDFGSHDGQLYLVMELVDGWSLAEERSLRGTLDPHEAAGIAAQVAAGLAVAHREGVIHRDIKPANVMLTTDRIAKITDFGIARFAGDAGSTLTATGKIVGTADYLAPERALGRPAQPGSDVYSLGCVLYELLTGRPPFQGTTSLAVVQQQVDVPPLPPAQLRPEIPPLLSEYLLHLLSKNPEHRPSAAQAASWLAGQEWTPSGTESAGTALLPAPVVPSSGPPRTAAGAPRSPRRGSRKPASKAVLGGAALALFGVAAAIGASLVSGDDSPSSPTSPAPTTITSVPADGTPGATAPSAAPTTAAPRAEDHEDDQGNGKHGKHGKDKGKGSDD
ncbi:protein kinase [Streptomyces sp. NPDC086549]|uniref:serine/threonine-protein kinase n=1 Tax=Streptomyces sp. NPDC086549 TaxID=3365752 RepID=UPI00380AC28F